MSLPTLDSYAGSNTNAYVVSIGDVDIYFSYKTPVAFRTPKSGLVVRQNDWGVTTGKHLNAIDGGRKADRVDGGTFERLYNEHVLTLIPA